MAFYLHEGIELLDPDGCVREHVGCLGCGYDLISLRSGQQCPECGAPVDLSVQGDLLQFSRPQWLNPIGHLVRIAGLLMLLLPITLAVSWLQLRLGSLVLPRCILLAWSGCVMLTLRREWMLLPTPKHHRACVWSAGAVGGIAGATLICGALEAAIDAKFVLLMTSVAYLGAVVLFARWLASLIGRIPVPELAESLTHRGWTVAGLGLLVMILAVSGLAGLSTLGFFVLPAWLLCACGLGYSCLQAGELILCEARRAQQNLVRYEALLEKERRFLPVPNGSVRPASAAGVDSIAKANY